MIEIKDPVIKKSQIEDVKFCKKEVKPKPTPKEKVEVYNPKFTLFVRKRKMMKSSSSLNTRSKALQKENSFGSDKLLLSHNQNFDISEVQVTEPTTDSLEENSRSSQLSQYSGSSKVLEYDKDYCKINKEQMIVTVKKSCSKVLLSQTPDISGIEANILRDIDQNKESKFINHKLLF